MTMKMTATALTAAGMLAMTSPAHAQEVTDVGGDSQALILVPLKLTKIEDLDFGTIVASPSAGTVVIPADGSPRYATGGVTPVPGDVGINGQFATAATPGQEVLFILTAPATLDDGLGNTINVLAMTMDGPAFRYADPTLGTIFVNVGGILYINANQPDGEYTGTFILYAEYR